jgi:hypothetical protein
VRDRLKLDAAFSALPDLDGCANLKWVRVQTEEEKMIARVWHGYTLPQHADAYEAMLKPELLPGSPTARRCGRRECKRTP